MAVPEWPEDSDGNPVELDESSKVEVLFRKFWKLEVLRVPEHGHILFKLDRAVSRRSKRVLRRQGTEREAADKYLRFCKKSHVLQAQTGQY